MNATRLAQLYKWVDTYAGSEYHHTDTAKADAMTTDLYLYWQGEQQPDDAVFLTMNLFASDFAAQAEFKLQTGDQVITVEDVL